MEYCKCSDAEQNPDEKGICKNCGRQIKDRKSKPMQKAVPDMDIISEAESEELEME